MEQCIKQNNIFNIFDDRLENSAFAQKFSSQPPVDILNLFRWILLLKTPVASINSKMSLNEFIQYLEL